MSEADYRQFIVKEYRYWRVYVHENQSYLGRVYIWLKRDEDIDFFLETTKEERTEFDEIAKALAEALKQLFQPDRLNWAALSNTANHCHVHLIPRYKTPRQFAGIEFTDENWGKNYAPSPQNTDVSPETLETIRQALADAL